MKKGKIISICVFVAIMTSVISCTGLKQGVRMRGSILDNDKMVLDEDTFDIVEQMNDSMLIVSERSEKRAQYSYLINKKSNGFYYMLIKARSIYPIENTKDLVLLDDDEVYDINKGCKCCRIPYHCDYGFWYLGRMDNLIAFSCPDTIFFSDGKCLGLRKSAYCLPTGEDGRIILKYGAQSIKVYPSELYKYSVAHKQKADTSYVRFSKRYFVQPRTNYESAEAGYSVEVDIPIGNSSASRSIRNWIMESVKDEAFELLGYRNIVPVANCRNVKETMSSLDSYGLLWEKLLRNDYQDGDTLIVRLFSDIEIRKVVDNADFVTYYFYACPYTGGLHEMPRSYYITYDKKRNQFLTTENAIKSSEINNVRNLTLKYLKVIYDENLGEESSFEDFTKAVFTFHCPFVDMADLEGLPASLLEHQYICDDMAGWDDVTTAPFTNSTFPLPHFAILPEGVVFTYHPYQIDCFAAGEYHVILPFDEISQYLRYGYSKGNGQLGLEYFFK